MAEEGQVKLLDETSSNFVGGQDASKFPSLIQEGQYFAGVNVNVANGLPVPRFGFTKKRITFPLGGITVPISNAVIPYDEVFHGGRFQAFIPYNIGNDYYLIIVVNGIIFLVNQQTWVASVLPIQGGGTLNENTPRLNWSPANKYLVIFDYPNLPVVFDGITIKRSSAFTNGIPTSKGGIYNQNRFFIYNAGNSYTAGDPTGSLATPQAPVTFKEIETPASPVYGEVFDLPTDRIEVITAMANLQLTDTSTGIGPLLIGTENAIYSAQAQTPRIIIDSQGTAIAGWEQNGFASAFVLNAGIAGPRACVNVNSDLFFMSPDSQVRTAMMSRTEQNKWARTPVSKEVQNWLTLHDKSLVQYTVGGYFKNKVFFTANPYRTNAFNTQRQPIYDFAFGGLVVLSLDNLATLGKDANPAWDGLWTGIRPMDMALNNKRFFLMSKDEESRNELYEMDPATTYDRDKDAIRYAPVTLYTREYDFKSPFMDKDAHSFDLDLRQVQGDLNVKVSYKTGQSSKYEEWRSFPKCAPWRACGIPADSVANGFASHSYLGFNLGSPLASETCALPSGVRNNIFRTVQFKLELSAKYWVLQGLRVKAIARAQNEEIYGVCDELTCVTVPKDCDNTDWKIGAFRSCLQHRT